MDGQPPTRHCRLNKMAAPVKSLTSFLPILGWAPNYTRTEAQSDLVAAVIVTIMLVPQSLAYAMLAGLPPQVGLYASILPLIAYALFGTSRALAVGPVAVVSLMTAAAVGQIAAPGTPEYLTSAITLAFLSGIVLIAMSVLRLGFLANFLSHPVISGFITASGILIATSQLKHILGIKAEGDTLPHLVTGIYQGIGDQPLHFGDRGLGDGLPFLGTQTAQTPFAGARLEASPGGHDGKGRAGGGHSAVDPRRGGLRPRREWREDCRRNPHWPAALRGAIL